MSKRIHLAVLLGLLGCAEDGEYIPPPPTGVDVSGIYELTAHTRNDELCDLEGEAVPGAPYFMMSWNGQWFSYLDCDRAAADSCYARETIGYKLSEPIEGGWERISAGGDWIQIQDERLCQLRYAESSLLAADGQVSLHVRVHGETVAAEASGCLSMANDRGTTMPCLYYEVLEGNRIGD